MNAQTKALEIVIGFYNAEQPDNWGHQAAAELKKMKSDLENRHYRCGELIAENAHLKMSCVEMYEALYWLAGGFLALCDRVPAENFTAYNDACATLAKYKDGVK